MTEPTAAPLPLLAAQLLKLHASKKLRPSIGGQQCGLEQYTIVADGLALECLPEAAAALAQRDGIPRPAVAWMYENDGTVHDGDYPPVLTTRRWTSCAEPYTETPLYAAPTGIPRDDARLAAILRWLMAQPFAEPTESNMGRVFIAEVAPVNKGVFNANAPGYKKPGNARMLHMLEELFDAAMTSESGEQKSAVAIESNRGER